MLVEMSQKAQNNVIKKTYVTLVWVSRQKFYIRDQKSVKLINKWKSNSYLTGIPGMLRKYKQ